MNITQETNQMETPKFLSDFPVIKYKGGYNITTSKQTTRGSIVFNMEYKPIWLHRFFCKLLLGWTWIDNK